MKSVVYGFDNYLIELIKFFMHRSQEIELPAHFHTAEYLTQSGIHYKKSIIDNAYKLGLGKLFYGSILIVIILLTLLCVFYSSIESRAVIRITILLIIIFSIESMFVFIKYMNAIRVRSYLRKKTSPLQIEPIAIVLLEPKTEAEALKNCKNCKTAFVYKELGTKKPDFYLSATFKGVPNKLPGSVALLYKHPIEDKYFTIDDDYEFVRQKVQEDCFAKDEESAVSNV
jgi:hypothetical protein